MKQLTPRDLRQSGIDLGLAAQTIQYVMATHPPTLAALIRRDETIPSNERYGRSVGPVPTPGFKAPRWQDKWDKSCLLCGGPLRAGERLDRTPIAQRGARFPHTLCARAHRAAQAQQRTHDNEAARRRRKARRRSRP